MHGENLFRRVVRAAKVFVAAVPMKLVPKLSVAFIAGVSIVLALNGYFRVRREVALFESDRVRDDVLIGEALGAAVETVWRREGEDAALALLRHASEREARVRLRWVWLDRTDVLAVEPALVTERAPGESVTRVAAGDGGEKGDDRRYTFLRVAVPEGRPGALEISESLTPERAYVRATIENTVATALALDGFCAALAMLLGAWLIGRPLGALGAKARRIGQGDFSGPLRMKQRDEIAGLAGEMNAMCDRLVEANELAAREMRSRIEMLEQLRHADRLMTVGKLASGVAHEIGTPLNVVEARAAMIAEGAMPPDESAEYARVIMRATERIARIIRQLLAFARRGAAQKSRCDLVLLARHTIELLGPLAAKRQVTLRVEDGGAPCLVDAEAPQIEQVLTNLVMNAIHATDGAGEVAITIDSARMKPPADLGGPEETYVRVRVRDRGRGIAPEHLAYVFEPFFTTKDVGEGTGLGLSIAYGIIREHAGWIFAESEPAHGTTLTFCLPRIERS
jgi:two-component system NtrC family sensor kinase